MARLAGRQVASGDAATAILIAASVQHGVKGGDGGLCRRSRLGSIVGGVSVLAIGALAVTFVVLR